MANFVIDKSRFNDEQRAQYEALVAIGKAEVDPEANQEEVVDDVPAAPAKKKTTEKAEVENMDKSAPAEFELPDFVKDAIAKSEKFIEEQQKKEMVDLAKKYDVLGLKPDELGPKLYEMKKSNEAMYDTVIATLDSQVALVEKSPLFAEIGKSGNAGGSYNGLSGSAAKAEAKAQELMKSDATMDYDTAIAKAWEDPDLMAEYDAEYFG